MQAQLFSPKIYNHGSRSFITQGALREPITLQSAEDILDLVFDQLAE